MKLLEFNTLLAAFLCGLMTSQAADAFQELATGSLPKYTASTAVYATVLALFGGFMACVGIKLLRKENK